MAWVWLFSLRAEASAAELGDRMVPEFVCTYASCRVEGQGGSHAGSGLDVDFPLLMVVWPRPSDCVSHSAELSGGQV